MATLRHCVLGAFTAEATDEQKQAMLEHLQALPAKIPEIITLAVGLDCGLAEGNHDFALNVDFADEAAYKVYATHPDHQEVIVNFIRPILKPGSRTAVQFRLARL